MTSYNENVRFSREPSLKQPYDPIGKFLRMIKRFILLINRMIVLFNGNRIKIKFKFIAGENDERNRNNQLNTAKDVIVDKKNQSLIISGGRNR